MIAENTMDNFQLDYLIRITCIIKSIRATDVETLTAVDQMK